MKSKNLFAVVLSAVVCLSFMTACTKSDSNNSQEEASKEESSAASVASEEQSTQSEQESKTEESSGAEQTKAKTHTLTVRDDGKSEKMTAHFINTMSGATEAVTMTKTGEGDDHFIYTCEGDITKYNMVHLEYGGEKPTLDVAFNEFVSGWYLSGGVLKPYLAGKEPNYDQKHEQKIFEFDGYDKDVYIWTPEGYDPESEEKYSTIYMFDAQWDLGGGVVDGDDSSWHVEEHVTSMMSLTDNKAIVVGLANHDKTRNDELIPDLGEMAIKNYPSKKRGSAFSDFIYNTVVPYIESNYNVYTDSEHNSITGSSLGGLEAFYVALDHPDKFGTAGALSPSFWAYDVKEWTKFLLPKLSEKNLPYIYLYGGDYMMDAGAYATLMNNALLQYGYPKEKLICSVYTPGEHLSIYWQHIMPEFLQVMFARKVSALENGAIAPVPDDVKQQIANYQSDASTAEREPTAQDYVYFDNSETKWDKVCAYWWGPYGASCTKITSSEYYSFDWPGTEMEKIGDTDIYRVLAPNGAVGIIFDNGVGDDSISEETPTYQTNDIEYDKKAVLGKLYSIDMTKEAKPGKGKEKYKFKYPAGTWSDYDSNIVSAG